jgi:hypothetical protein
MSKKSFVKSCQRFKTLIGLISFINPPKRQKTKFATKTQRF